jgi:uncharacterized membrane protein
MWPEPLGHNQLAETEEIHKNFRRDNRKTNRDWKLNTSLHQDAGVKSSSLCAVTKMAHKKIVLPPQGVAVS